MNDAQEDEAHNILDLLTTCYPGHPWSVRVYDGGFFIRHLELPSKWGMNCKFKKVSMSASMMKREIIMMAGEYLERAGLDRGRNINEDPIDWVEGVPAKCQPLHSKPAFVVDEIVIAGSEDGFPREEPRRNLRKPH